MIDNVNEVIRSLFQHPTVRKIFNKENEVKND